MSITATDRIDRLRERAVTRQRRGGQTYIYDPDHQLAAARLAQAVYGQADPSTPPVLQTAHYLRAFAGQMPVAVHDDELIVGDQTFSFFQRNPQVREQLGEVPFRGNAGHIAVDYQRVVRTGIDGLRRQVEQSPCTDDTSRANQKAFLITLDALAHFITRHARAAEDAAAACPDATRRRELVDMAEACTHLVHHGARTFHEALQMTWFVQVFLHAEGDASAVSFGRFDVTLGPYLETTERQDAAELLAAFFIKCCEGDQSQNLTLGGVDRHGRPLDNPLTELVLAVMHELNLWQPSLSLRVHDATPRPVLHTALALAADGTGQPSFFNDRVAVEGLQALGVDAPEARNWSVVGCYEAAPDGNSYPLTTLGGWSLPEVLLDYLAAVDDAPDYAAFEDGLRQHMLRDCAERVMADLQARRDRLCRECPSPLESLCVTGCIDSGRTTQEGGARHNLAGVMVLGLATLVDSLHAVRQVVFDTGAMTLRELKVHLADDLADETVRARLRNLPGKFGSDDPRTNDLACRWSTFVAQAILDSRLRDGVRPYPGFFWFLQDVRRNVPATPDGRRAGEPLSYGAGPGTLARHGGPTSVLASAGHVAHRLAACGNPLLLSMNRADVEGEAGLDRLGQLIAGYFAQGGFHVHVNVVDAAELRHAQQHPEEHTGQLVRISGFSARFTSLDRTLQDAIIERTEHGL